MERSAADNWNRVCRIVRAVCLVTMITAAFCEWRDGAVTRLASRLFKQRPNQQDATDAAGTPLFHLDPPAHMRSVSGEDLQLAQLRAAIVLSGQGHAVTWALPHHLSAVPYGGTDPESRLPYEVVSRRDGATLVLVPGGRFAMGAASSVPDARPSEYPMHMVNLPPYYVGKTEVTRAQYDRFCRATGHHPIPLRFARHCPQSEYPVVGVTRDDARTYCAWAGASLPTEAQWEKAARGTDGRHYPWGNEPPEKRLDVYANCAKAINTASDGVLLRPVGRFPEGASPYGALDMAGNVAEWCRDLFAVDTYRKSPAFHPTGAARSVRHVIRGGSWSSGAESIRTFSRASRLRDNLPDSRTGFRVVVNVAPVLKSRAEARLPRIANAHADDGNPDGS